MIDFPIAKINIGLQVVGKRPDGFHEISGLFYPVNLTDVLEILPASYPSPGFFCYGPEKRAVDPEDNLIKQAIEKLRPRKELPEFHTALYKKIPAGSGLGGGSSNAASTIKMLNREFELGLSLKEMAEIALDLGSDCPFFIYERPAIASGRGEELQFLESFLKDYHWVIVHSGKHISTTEAYQNIIPKSGRKDLTKLIDTPLKEWKEAATNDFEEFAFKKYPELKSIKDELYRSGALYASMTGSGSAIFGIFESHPTLPKEGLISKATVFKGSFKE